MAGWVTLIGSGETAASMTEVHRTLLKALAETPQPVFLETPAGFERGLEAIRSRFLEYFGRSFGLPLATAPYCATSDGPQVIARSLSTIAKSNYILAGPGSPTYAVRQWEGSAVWAAVVERWLGGAQLVLASSAAIAISRHTLPVYEIYKVGQELHWTDGLDLLGRFGLELVIVSHWDNAEGGTHDTRACFMGLERFERLRQLLPPTAVVLGVDEHTACTLEPESGMARLRGRGGVTILRGAETIRYTTGTSFPLSDLIATQEVRATHGSPQHADRPAAAGGFHPPPGSQLTEPPTPLSRAAEAIAAGRLAEGLRAAAEAADPDLALLLHRAALAAEESASAQEPLEALVGLLLEARAGLRAARQWDLADRLRGEMNRLGIEVRDTPEGAAWEKTSPARQ
jgi:hypothetical protein